MTSAPDPLAALGFAAAHGLDSTQSSDAFLANLRSGEAEDLMPHSREKAQRRAYWRAYARMTNGGRTSDELLAEARGENNDGDRPVADKP